MIHAQGEFSTGENEKKASTPDAFLPINSRTALTLRRFVSDHSFALTVDPDVRSSRSKTKRIPDSTIAEYSTAVDLEAAVTRAFDLWERKNWKPFQGSVGGPRRQDHDEWAQIDSEMQHSIRVLHVDHAPNQPPAFGEGPPPLKFFLRVDRVIRTVTRNPTMHRLATGKEPWCSDKFSDTESYKGYAHIRANADVGYVVRRLVDVTIYMAQAPGVKGVHTHRLEMYTDRASFENNPSIRYLTTASHRSNPHEPEYLRAFFLFPLEMLMRFLSNRPTESIADNPVDDLIFESLRTFNKGEPLPQVYLRAPKQDAFDLGADLPMSALKSATGRLSLLDRIHVNRFSFENRVCFDNDDLVDHLKSDLHPSFMPALLADRKVEKVLSSTPSLSHDDAAEVVDHSRTHNSCFRDYASRFMMSLIQPARVNSPVGGATPHMSWLSVRAATFQDFKPNSKSHFTGQGDQGQGLPGFDEDSGEDFERLSALSANDVLRKVTVQVNSPQGKNLLYVFNVRQWDWLPSFYTEEFNNLRWIMKKIHGVDIGTAKDERRRVTRSVYVSYSASMRGLKRAFVCGNRLTMSDLIKLIESEGGLQNFCLKLRVAVFELSGIGYWNLDRRWSKLLNMTSEDFALNVQGRLLPALNAMAVGDRDQSKESGLRWYAREILNDTERTRRLCSLPEAVGSKPLNALMPALFKLRAPVNPGRLRAFTRMENVPTDFKVLDGVAEWGTLVFCLWQSGKYPVLNLSGILDELEKTFNSDADGNSKSSFVSLDMRLTFRSRKHRYPNQYQYEMFALNVLAFIRAAFHVDLTYSRDFHEDVVRRVHRAMIYEKFEDRYAESGLLSEKETQKMLERNRTPTFHPIGLSTLKPTLIERSVFTQGENQ